MCIFGGGGAFFVEAADLRHLATLVPQQKNCVKDL